MDVTLIYKNCVVNLNEYHSLLNRRGLKILIDAIKKYNESEKIRIIKRKKVTRKNKHVGKEIVVAGVSIIILGTCSLGLAKSKDLSIDDKGSYYTVQDEISNDQVT